MPLIDLNNTNFDDEIERYPVTIIDFWAPWCQPCKAFAPIFESAAERHPDILFARINCDDEPTLAQQFEVRSIPTLLAAKDGTIVKAQMGGMLPDAFENMIKDLKK
jgi:thioredoxin